MTMVPIVETLSQWVGQATGAATVLVVLVLLVQRTFRKRLTPAWRYNLWLLVVVRLALPVWPESPWSLFNLASVPRDSARLVWHETQRMPSEGARRETEVLGAGAPSPSASILSHPTNDAPSSAPPIVPLPGDRARVPSHGWPPTAQEWITAGRWLWFAVALLFGGRLLWDYGRLRRRLHRAPLLKAEALLSCWTEAEALMRTRRRLDLIETDLIQSPAIFGLLRGRLLLPRGLTARFSGPELRYVFLHELAHLKRGDLFVNWLMTVLQVLHWFNPVIWFALGRMRADRELACDTLALSVTQEEDRKPYGQTIIKLLEGFARPAAVPGLVGILEDKRQMHRRIQMIAKFKRTSRQPWLAVALVALLGLITLTDAQTERDNAKSPTTPVGADTVVDPNTGLRFVVSQTIAGTNDVIDEESWVTLSPNGKFLLYLWEGRIVPLDGSPAFTLQELQGRDVDAWSATWSPDGRKIAFHARGIEVLPVSPDTGRPTGPARHLLEDKERWFRGRIYWSADSEQILFVKWKNDVEWEAGSSITLRDGRVNRQPDYADFGLVSPDGNTIAYSIPTDGIWTRPVNGGASRIVRARSRGWIEDAQLWTADSRWVVSVADGWGWKNVHFTRLSDGQNFDLVTPEAVGAFLGKSTDGKKLYFYRSSFDPSPGTFKVVPISGGPVSSIGPFVGFDEIWDYSWTSDSAALAMLAWDWDTGERRQLWLVPLDGRGRVRFNMESPGKENTLLWVLSPDSRKLLYAVRRGTDQAIQSLDLYVVPVSLRDGQATSPATLVFDGPQSRHLHVPRQELAWSPDGTRIAMPLWAGSKRELWILSADGGKPVQIIQAEGGFTFTWSPDSKLIAFRLVAPDRQMLRVIPAEGGTARTVLTTLNGQPFPFGWSPDSKELVAACDGTITSIPIAGGTGRVIVRWQDAGYESVSWLGWSPDGQHLAFYGEKKGEPSRLCLFAPDTGRVATLNNSPEDASDFTWSPDSKMICCTVEEPVKTRPAGVIRELDVAEALQKAPPIAEKKPAEIKPAPQAEPITGPVFSDHFDNGLSKYWRFQDMPDRGLGPGRHAVENGELILSDARALLDVPDWTDYIVTVRVCMKEVVASGDGGFGISARAVPSQFGSSRMDRYGLGIFWNNASPYLCLGLYYADASNTLRRGMLRQSSYSAVIDQWYTLEFEVRGQHLRGYLDGKLVIEATDTRLSKGKLWIEANKSRALFDDFSVRQLP